jgi:hypothetical protein
MKRNSATSAPMPGFLEPMKAKLVDSIPPGDWMYEVKFDGYRALGLRGGVGSEELRELISRFKNMAANPIPTSILVSTSGTAGRFGQMLVFPVPSDGRNRGDQHHCPER